MTGRGGVDPREVPVYWVPRTRSAPADLVYMITAITDLTETKGFQKQLAELPDVVRRQWQDVTLTEPARLRGQVWRGEPRETWAA